MNRMLLAVVSFLLLAAVSFAAEESHQEQWKDEVHIELTPDAPAEADAELVVIFPDGDKSVLLTEQGRKRLVAEPIIRSVDGLDVEVISIAASEVDVNVNIGIIGHRISYIGAGYSIPCRVRFKATGDLETGDYEVSVSLSQTSMLAEELGVDLRLHQNYWPPTYLFHVKVWESRQAQLAAQRAEEEQRNEGACANFCVSQQ